MRTRSLLRIPAAAFTYYAALAAPAQAVTAVSNMDNPEVAGFTALAINASFTASSQPAVLSSIYVRYFCTSSTFGMNLFAYLRADAGGQPGAVLEVLPEQTGPAGHGVATFPSAGTLLAPHTTYWLYLDSRTSTFWETTSLPTESSAYGWTIGDHVYNGDFIPGSGRFSVDVTFVPEPAALAFVGVATLPLLGGRRRCSSS